MYTYVLEETYIWIDIYMYFLKFMFIYMYYIIHFSIKYISYVDI